MISTCLRYAARKGGGRHPVVSESELVDMRQGVQAEVLCTHHRLIVIVSHTPQKLATEEM
jgi:hypothetical protein